MGVQIEINEKDVEALTMFFVQRLKVLREEIMEREKEIKSITNTIQMLRKPVSSSSDSAESAVKLTNYSDKWTWLKKVQFAIEQAGAPLTTKEIVDVLTEYETTFIYDRKRAVASISSVLSGRWGADKEFSRTESKSGDFAYFLNIKPENQTEEVVNETVESDVLPF